MALGHPFSRGIRSPGVAVLSRFFAALLVLVTALALPTRGADLETVQGLARSGKYEVALRAAQEAIKDRPYSEDWRLLEASMLFTLGRYPEAWTAVNASVRRHSGSLKLRLLAHDIALANGQIERAHGFLEEINDLAGGRRWAFRDPGNMVGLGQAALLLGADSRRVLDNFFEPARKADPKLREVYLRAGRLALNKKDFALASKWLQDGLKQFPDDPDLLAGLAEAFEPSDRSEMAKTLEKVWKQNERHLDAHLLLAEQRIDEENYAEAAKLLDKLNAVNPAHPKAWALRAVLAHLQNRPSDETAAQTKALEFWTNNPVVPFTIGQKLSEKYRFAEGSARQRQALAWDANYLPAKIQLAQDLLRLGQEDEGWALADSVANADGYEVAAYNLVTLHGTVREMVALTNEFFTVRMEAREARIYGADVLGLLAKARARLSVKYQSELPGNILVEIFPEQKDFAIRTFGMPGGEGYLAVCFGPVITANSPAGQADHPSNWQAMLWHEFCHSITLHLTRNKMPRWLSEGISVYEERLANPAWGQGMTPKYREMILTGGMKKIGDLSAAFMAPPTPLALQFAYFQSSMVVGFLVEQFGFEKLLGVLRDLGDGAAINDALEKHTAPLVELEKRFEQLARSQAQAFGNKLDWSKVKPGEHGGATWQSSTNFAVLSREAAKFIEKELWPSARAVLEKIITLHPGANGPDNPWALLAMIEKKTGRTGEEMALLRRWAAEDAEALPAFERLLELSGERQQWAEAVENGGRFLAVNPLRWEVYEKLARAEEAAGHPRDAIRRWEQARELDPPDAPRVHFELARLLHADGQRDRARQAVLESLEEAPRFRNAQKLLLEILEKKAAAAP